LTNVLQADGKFKIRPALLLRYMPPFNDCLVCGISTQLHHQVKSFDEIAYPHKTEFMNSGLKQVSLIRLGFLVIIGQLTTIFFLPCNPLKKNFVFNTISPIQLAF